MRTMPTVPTRVHHLARRAVEAEQRAFRHGVVRFVREAGLVNLLTIPAIYSLLLPFFVVDMWVSLYQWTCFPIYGISRVRRGRYFVVDRHRLAYLNGIEKLNCAYCSYANGVVAYVREVAARTEQYWCPIRHARAIPAPHARYRQFVAYGEAARYRRELPRLRRALTPRTRRTHH
jgi:hypothetical protein